MTRTTLRGFIRQHRQDIDAAIARAMSRPGTPVRVEHLYRRNDEERRLWVLNDEGLYHWARAEGVRL